MYWFGENMHFIGYSSIDQELGPKLTPVPRKQARRVEHLRKVVVFWRVEILT